jgi:type I restriction enzyme R subunit
MDPRRLYESPFTDIAPSGPGKIFDLPRSKDLVRLIEQMNESATA